MTERKKVTRYHMRVEYSSLNDIIEAADSVISTHEDMTYKDFEFEDYNDDPWSGSSHIHLTYMDDETDKEMILRLKKEEEHKKNRAEYDKREFDRLKKLFEGK